MQYKNNGVYSAADMTAELGKRILIDPLTNPVMVHALSSSLSLSLSLSFLPFSQVCMV